MREFKNKIMIGTANKFDGHISTIDSLLINKNRLTTLDCDVLYIDEAYMLHPG